MAMSPGTMERTNDAMVDEFEERIDNHLDREVIEDGQVTVVIGGEITGSYRDELAKRYTEAGWVSMVFQTSSENGERPGLTQVTLRA